jgi:dihydrofolate reductase
MIRFIAALDSKLGVADDHGIPWQGLVPGDVAYFREKTSGGILLMGSGFYHELDKPLPNRENVVASRHEKDLKPGFTLVSDAVEYLKSADKDVWVAGGAALFDSTLDMADELYLTRIDKDFNCTKFFPSFESKFELANSSDPLSENGVSYHFEVWRRK